MGKGKNGGGVEGYLRTGGWAPAEGSTVTWMVGGASTYGYGFTFESGCTRSRF